MPKHFSIWLIRAMACKLCIPLTGGCCNFALDHGWKIFVFPWEARRIAEYTGKDIAEFIDIGPLASEQLDYIRSDVVKDPLWARLFSLWSNPPGFRLKCPFVSKDGCQLPYHIKPFICQIFPLDFNITHNKIVLRLDMGCFLPLVTRSTDEIALCFDDRRDNLNERFQSFRKELLQLLHSVEQQTSENKHLDGQLDTTPL